MANVVAVPAVIAAFVVCTVTLPPAPVVPPVAFTVSPLVLKVRLVPLKNTLLVGTAPTEPDPRAFAEMVTSVAPVPNDNGPPKLLVPTASSDTTPPRPLPAAVTLMLAVVL